MSNQAPNNPANTISHSTASKRGRAPRELPVRRESNDGYFPLASVGGAFGVTAELVPYARIVDYQEKRAIPEQGYYRLCRHPIVRRLEARVRALIEVPVVQLVHSPGLAAEELAHFLSLTPGPWSVVEMEGVPDRWPEGATHVVCALAEGVVRMGLILSRESDHAPLLWERIRKRGAVPSARDAALLCGESPGTEPREEISDAICHELRVLSAAPHCSLYPTGMGALVAAVDAMWNPNRPDIAIVGHLYSDTHVLLSEMPWHADMSFRSHFLRADQAESLAELLADANVGLVFVETITNPLVEIPNLPRIIELARAAGARVLVDNTMASPANCRPLELGAHAVVESTTKYLSGGNDHGGGAVLTGDTAISTRLVAEQGRLGSGMSGFEGEALMGGMTSYLERMPRFNDNGRRMAAFLREHPAVAQVWFPTDDQMAQAGHIHGAASVVSFTLQDGSLEALTRFLETPMSGVYKAPSLGSDVTLLCPYTLLTYFHRDAAYLDEIRLPRHLLRFSVGCEVDFEPVLDAVRNALD